MKISVSILSSKNILLDLKKLDVTNLEYIHIDIMDAKFVPNKSFQYKDIKKVSNFIRKRLDVHLMVTNPINYIKQFAELNTEIITFHVEIKENIRKVITLIKEYGMKVGLAISPNTDINVLDEHLNDIDLILIMSVNPGMGGQEFMDGSIDRVKEIYTKIKKVNKKILLSIDGGINDKTVCNLKGLPLDIIVSGSFVINSDNYQKSIDLLRIS